MTSPGADARHRFRLARGGPRRDAGLVGASILIDADSGKVLRADNATYPWYPASTTKLMTLYMALSAVRDNRITFDTLFTVSRNANLQAPVKMGLPVGTQVTVDNALKMMMVKSANDMAVVLAEGVGGSVDDFAQQMTDTAHKLGMSESNFVNPNGLPADGQITSARDLAILARALIREFPDYSFYWHVPAIKFGRRIVRNYNPLLGRYPGADGMKTGFICASGFNLVATATRDGRRLIAVVLGAPSSGVRAVKAAHLLEQGFTAAPAYWLTPSLGSVESLTPVDAAPANLHEEMCGQHRKRPAAEEEEDVANTPADSPYAVFLSSLRPQAKGSLLQTESNLGEPVVVFTGPPKSQALGQGAQVASADPKAAKPVKPTAAAKTAAPKPSPTGSPATPDGGPAVATASTVPWTSLSPAALAASPPTELGATVRASVLVPLPRARPRVAARKPADQVTPSQ